LSAIFLSHSSIDNAVAMELRSWLEELGFASIFLDFDPEQGIPPGRDWEKELYSQLRSCRAVIVLCSGHSMASPWCFAEITHARALGKALFPVKVVDCKVHPILQTVQLVDLTVHREEGLARLRRGLEQAGLDSANSFDWQRTRSPYPGLAAFDADDAAVFFGRDAEIGRGLDLLNRQRRFGGARFVLVLGASGSGKSSLLRAGLLPRLRRAPAQWLVVPPFRPFGRPLESLAFALAEAFATTDAARSWQDLVGVLEKPGASLARLADELAFGRRQPEATVLLCADQLEELLTLSTADEADRFLKLLRDSAEAPASRLLVVATVRSDFLGLVQSQPALHGATFAELLVGPMPMARVGEVIEGPAAVAGLELEPGLVQAMVSDTGEAGALPLLAFALRELWEHRTGERLTMAQYAGQLGGITGSVAKAAEEVLANYQALTPRDETELRQAFLSLVRINDEGRFTRRPAGWSTLPERIHPLLEKFVQARLLVSRQDVSGRLLEVAHEALFGSWARLAAWLAVDRAFLFWRKRLDQALETWTGNARKGDWLLTGAMLRESEDQLKERGDSLDVDEKAFLKASISADRRQRRNRLAVVGAVILAMAGAAVFSALQWREATVQGELQVARRLATESRVVFAEGDIRRSLLLAAASLKSAWTLDGAEAWSQAVDLTFARRTLATADAKGPWSDVVFSRDGTRIAAANAAEILIIDGEKLAASGSAAIVARFSQPRVNKLVFSPDGQFLVAAAGPRCVIWNVSAASPVTDLPLAHRDIESLAFDSEGKRLVTAGMNYYARLFETEHWTEIGWVGNTAIHAAAFSPDGKWLVTSGGDAFSAWKLETTMRRPGNERGGEDATSMLDQSGTTSKVIAYFGDGLLVGNGAKWRWSLNDIQSAASAQKIRPFPEGAITAVNRQVSNVAVAFGQEIVIWQEPTEQGEWGKLGHILADARTEGLPSIAFAPVFSDALAYSDWLVSAGDQLERVDLRSSAALAQTRRSAPIVGLAVSRDGKFLAMTTADGAVEILDSGTLASLKREPIPLSGPDVNSMSQVAFSGDGRWLAASIDGYVTILSTADWRPVSPWDEGQRPKGDALGFSPDGRWLALVDGDKKTIALTDIAARRTVRFAYGDVIDAVSIRHDGAQFRTRRDPRCQRNRSMDGQEQVWEASGREVPPPIPVPLSGVTCDHAAMVEALAPSMPASDPIGSDWTTIRLDRGSSSLLKSPDGQWSASIESDINSLRLRAMESPDRPGIGYRAGLVGKMVFSPDSRWLATGGSDGIVSLWAVGAEPMILQACSRVRQFLSAEEWTKHLGEQPASPVCEQTSGSFFDWLRAQGSRVVAWLLSR
jgi:WD40 repeat protein